MSDSMTLDDLLAQQRAMSEVASQLIDETDTDRIQQIAAELAEMGARLQEAGERVAAAAVARAPDGATEVVLTPEQRERIEASTGVRIDSIRLSDPGGLYARAMPSMDPRLVEHYALLEAERRRATRAAEDEVRARLAATIAEIEEQGTPALREQLERLKADPTFLGGLLVTG